MHTTLFNVAENFCFGGNHQLRKPWSEGRNTIRKILNLKLAPTDLPRLHDCRVFLHDSLVN